MAIGMKEQDIDKILAQFRQVDGSSTRRAEGTGLGLAITQHLIISVFSKRGLGKYRFKFSKIYIKQQ